MRILFALWLTFGALMANRVEVNFFISPTRSSPNELPFAIEIKIPERSHIGTPDDKDSPTTLEFELPENLEITNVSWPKAKTISARDTAFPAYEGTIYAHGVVTGANAITPEFALKHVRANISYTVCDKLCVPEKASVTPKLLSLDEWREIPKPKVKPAFFSEQMFLMFALALLGGLLLNLMPCVLPILSLKVISIASTEHPKHLKQSGVFFTLGTLVGFWGLALFLYMAKAAGNQIGWGFQLQSPFVVISLCFVFLTLAMNLFGVFEIGASFARLAGKAKGSNKPSAGFFSGLLACVVATPCSAPFMGAAVGFALTQNSWRGLIIFTGLALGIAAPYWLICSNPRLVKLLPKPGSWMGTLKIVLGFAMMGSLVWLLSILAAQVDTARVLSVLTSLLVVAAACWVYGHFGAFHRSATSRTVGILVAIGLVALAATNAFATSGSERNREWIPFNEKEIEKQRVTRPVFIDFTAKWCVTCQINKRLVLNARKTRELFTRKNVALFRADWTNYDPEITKALENYDRCSVPFYVLLLPDGTHKTLPEVLTIEIIEDALSDLG